MTGRGRDGRSRNSGQLYKHAIRKGGGGGGDQLMFEVLFLQTPRRHKTVTFKALCGPGDEGEPVISTVLPNED